MGLGYHVAPHATVVPRVSSRSEHRVLFPTRHSRRPKRSLHGITPWIHLQCLKNIKFAFPGFNRNFVHAEGFVVAPFPAGAKKKKKTKSRSCREHTTVSDHDC
jgi:hypothetical protein